MHGEGGPIYEVAGTYWQGAQTFMVSTHSCPKHTPYTPSTPTPNLQQVLQQHHLGMFLTFYLLG